MSPTQRERVADATEFFEELVRRELWPGTDRRMRIPHWMPKKLEAQLRRSASAVVTQSR